MSSGQSSVSNVHGGSNTSSPLSRKRPYLPPINSTVPMQAALKIPSPTTSMPTMPEPRSSRLHELLNYAVNEPRLETTLRYTSESPASSAGPLTPGASLPSMNALTGPRPSLPILGPGLPNVVDHNKKHIPFFGAGRRTPPPSLPRASLPRLQTQDDGRRGSDASMFSSTSPTTSMGSSFGTAGRPSPPRQGSITHHPIYTNGNYQFMTANGIVVPVDTQQASRLADEKRKRNAGASARFRQRRKEKEKESTQTIQQLENQVRELKDMTGWYRDERDFYRQLCTKNGLQAHIAPRPASPRLRQITPSHSTATTPAGEWQQQGERGADEGRNQRRRVDYFDGVQIAAAPPPPPPSPPAQQQQQQHQQQQMLHHQPPQGAPATHNLHHPQSIAPFQQPRHIPAPPYGHSSTTSQDMSNSNDLRSPYNNTNNRSSYERYITTRA